jgi:hypothetical protein
MVKLEQTEIAILLVLKLGKFLHALTKHIETPDRVSS